MSHAHTIPVEADAASKLTLLSGSGLGGLNADYKRRFYWEQPPAAPIKSKKIKFEKVDAETPETIWKTATKHMMMTREINIEYKGLKNKEKKTLDILMTFMNTNGKPVIIDEKTNTAGGLKKDSVKQKLKKVFGLDTGNLQKQMVHLSKYNGDVGQVLEKWRPFTLINEEGTTLVNPTLNQSIAFETNDCNAASRAFLEVEDIILLHTWPKVPGAYPERLVVFKKTVFDDIKKRYASIKNEYKSLYTTLTAEVLKYNTRRAEINTQLVRFTTLVNSYNPIFPDDVSVGRINDEYKNALNFYLTASVLQNFIPEEQIPDEDVVLPAQIATLNENVATEAELNDSYIGIKAQIQALESVRGSLKISPSFADLALVEEDPTMVNEGPPRYRLKNVDLEKHVTFEAPTTNNMRVKVDNVLSDIDIFAELRQNRIGLTSSFSQKLGLKCINFIFNKKEKIASFKQNMWLKLKTICERLGANTRSKKNFDNIATCLPKNGAILTFQSQRAPVVNIDILSGGTIINNIKYLSEKVEDIEGKVEFLTGQRFQQNMAGILKSAELSTYAVEETLEYTLTFDDGEKIKGTINIDESLSFMELLINEVKDALETSNKISNMDDETEIIKTIYEYMNGPMSGGARRTIIIPQPSSRSRSRGRITGNRNGERERERGRDRGRSQFNTEENRRERRRRHSASRSSNNDTSRNRRRGNLRNRTVNRNRERNRFGHVYTQRRPQQRQDVVLDIDFTEIQDELNEDTISSSFCLLEYDLEMVFNLYHTLNMYKNVLRRNQRRNDIIEELERKIQIFNVSFEEDNTWFENKQKVWHEKETKNMIGGERTKIHIKKTRKNRKIHN
jgi:hypothetical protein